MHAWGPLLIKKLDIAILFFYFVNLKICPKLWTYFTLKLSWPIICTRTNVKKLNEVSTIIREKRAYAWYFPEYYNYYDTIGKIEVRKICHRPVTMNVLP